MATKGETDFTFEFRTFLAYSLIIFINLDEHPIYILKAVPGAASILGPFFCI